LGGGISIGAINARSSPATRRQQLTSTSFRKVRRRRVAGFASAIAGENRRTSSLNALMFGQPGFFAPRPTMHWLLGVTPASYYDTSALKDTLERLVDFDRINAREIRFSIGAVNVRTGNFVYFDNAQMTIRPEHVMASGALPPGFPAVEIDGEYYWDGSLVSNTPLQYVLECIPRLGRLTFVDCSRPRAPANRSRGRSGARDGHPLFQQDPCHHRCVSHDA
jgi:NTE family protein